MSKYKVNTKRTRNVKRTGNSSCGCIKGSKKVSSNCPVCCARGRISPAKLPESVRRRTEPSCCTSVSTGATESVKTAETARVVGTAEVPEAAEAVGMVEILEITGATGTIEVSETVKAVETAEVPVCAGASESIGAVIKDTETIGATGPNVTANNLVTRLGFQTIKEPASIVFLGPNTVINGTAITHTINSPTISLAPSQVYQVSYNLTLQNSSEQDANLLTGFLLDNTPIFNSITSIPRGSTITTSNIVLVDSESNGSILELNGRSIGNIPVNIVPPSQVNVIKLQ